MNIFTKLMLAGLPLAMAFAACTTDNTDIGPDGPAQSEIWIGSLAPAPYASDAACYKLTNAKIDDTIIESIELSASGLYYIIQQPRSYVYYDDETTRSAEDTNTPFFRSFNKSLTRDWLPYESILTGNYTKLSNGKYRLDGFGDIDVASDGKVDITLTSGQNYLWKCELMPKIPDTMLNARLCRAWKTLSVKIEFLDKKYKTVFTHTCTQDEIKEEYIQGLTFTSAGKMYEYDEGDWYSYSWNWSNEKGQLIQLMADDPDDGSGICQVTFDNNKINFINPFVFEDAEDAREEFYYLNDANQIPSSTRYAREIVTLIEW